MDRIYQILPPNLLFSHSLKCFPQIVTYILNFKLLIKPELINDQMRAVLRDLRFFNYNSICLTTSNAFYRKKLRKNYSKKNSKANLLSIFRRRKRDIMTLTKIGETTLIKKRLLKGLPLKEMTNFNQRCGLLA
jgi:hypothetical protein